MNIKQLMKQAQQMQDQMQRQMASIRVEGTAGGGMVKAEMSGNKELLSISIFEDRAASLGIQLLEPSASSMRQPSGEPRSVGRPMTKVRVDRWGASGRRTGAARRRRDLLPRHAPSSFRGQKCHPGVRNTVLPMSQEGHQ